MRRELEALLEALDALKQASPPAAEAKEVFYEAMLEDVSDQLKLDKSLLNRLVLRKHRAWLRAQQKPPSLPPKA